MIFNMYINSKFNKIKVLQHSSASKLSVFSWGFLFNFCFVALMVVWVVGLYAKVLVFSAAVFSQVEW